MLYYKQEVTKISAIYEKWQNKTAKTGQNVAPEVR